MEFIELDNLLYFLPIELNKVIYRFYDTKCPECKIDMIVCPECEDYYCSNLEKHYDNVFCSICKGLCEYKRTYFNNVRNLNVCYSCYIKEPYIYSRYKQKRN